MNKKIYLLIEGGALLGVYAKEDLEIHLLDLDRDDINKSASLDAFNEQVEDYKHLSIAPFGDGIEEGD